MIVACPPGKNVISFPGIQNVVPILSEQPVVIVIALDTVVAAAAVDRVFTIETAHDVCKVCAVQQIGFAVSKNCRHVVFLSLSFIVFRTDPTG
jgi:hypothetical protein